MNTKIIKIDALTKKHLNETFDKGLPIPFPTETVFGLGAPYDQKDVIENIFNLKGRPQNNPLIVHVSNRDMIDEIAYVTRDANKLIQSFFPGPLTIVLKKRAHVLDLVTAKKQTVAVRMPSHPVALALIERIGKPIVAPSANISGKPSSTKVSHVYDDLNGRIPYIIEGQPSHIGIESTIVDLTQKPYTILRPGYIKKESLIRVLGNVFHGQSKTIAPGMIHPHYEPNHPLYILKGSDSDIIMFMKKKDDAVFIGHKRFQSHMKNMMSLGEDERHMIKHLYDVLRQTNKLNVNAIYTHEIQDDAYMNRLIKAAKGNIINVIDALDTP